MCGSVSAIGLTGAERRLWPVLRERLRLAGHLMALMRGVLGDAEVAVITAVTPEGRVKILGIMASPQEILDEIHLVPPVADPDWQRPQAAKIGDYDAQVLVEVGPDGRPRPVAVLATAWIEQNLLLYARQLWRRRGPRAAN
jgi:hypothetical protein